MARSRILALACACAALALAGGPARPAGADDTVLKIYDVSGLVATQPDFPGPELNGAPSRPGEMGGIAVSETVSQYLTEEDIEKAIKTNFAEDSWEDSKHSLTFGGGTLVVVNRPEVHVAIARYLAVLRALRARQVQVEATLVELTPAVLDALEAGPLAGGAGIVLGDQQLAALEAALERATDARVVRAGRVSAFSGQRVHSKDLHARAYVKDYNCEIAENAAIAKPVPAFVDEGFVFDVRPLIEFGESRVTLHLRFHQQSLVGPMASFDTTVPKMGRVQLPVVEHTGLMTTLSMPPGATALVGLASDATGTGAGRCQALLLRPTISKPLPEPAERPESSEKRQLEVYDVGFLLATIGDYPAPAIEPAGLRPDTSASVGATFGGEPLEYVIITSEQMVNLIQAHIAPDSWSNTRNRLWMSSGGQLMVVQAPEVLKQIREYLEALARARRNLIQVEMMVLGVAGRHAVAGTRKGPLAQGAAVGPEALRALLEEARKGGDVQVLAQAAVAGFNRERVHVIHTLRRAIVGDYDVELAKDATISDPVIRFAHEGLAFDVMPTRMGDGGLIVLELRPTLARAVTAPTPFATQAAAGGILHLIDTDLFQPQTNVAVRDGEWTVAAVARDASGDGDKVLLVRAWAEKSK